jgi:hypothetical protein
MPLISKIEPAFQRAATLACDRIDQHAFVNAVILVLDLILIPVRTRRPRSWCQRLDQTASVFCEDLSVLIGQRPRRCHDSKTTVNN